jgi:hypothetical protein
MTFSHRVFIGLVMSIAGSTAAQGEMRQHYEDATIVERSELIVVGRLIRESILYVPHERKPGDGRSWEHHGTLLVSEVFKGKAAETEIPIVIHYGLLSAEALEEGQPLVTFDEDFSISGSPGLGDMLADNIWFLRRRSGIYGETPGTGKLGIVDPEDLQPLKWKDYFLAYLAPDPETAVVEDARRNPAASERAKTYLDHLEIQRIRKIEDPGERFDKLLPYFLSFTRWGETWEAREGILSCGPVAGARLRAPFLDPRHRAMREKIIEIWRDLGTKAAAPLLIRMLRRHNRFWQEQHLEKGWWNDVGSPATPQRREIYGEVLTAVSALRSFQDPRARGVLEATRDLWKKINLENSQIADTCEAALRELPEPHR